MTTRNALICTVLFCLVPACSEEGDTIIYSTAVDPLPDVTGFSAVASGTTIDLSWTPPFSDRVQGVTVRRSVSDYPITPHDGEPDRKVDPVRDCARMDRWRDEQLASNRYLRRGQ